MICICGSSKQSILKYSKNFKQKKCINCESVAFFPINNDSKLFNYNSFNEKYSSDSYLYNSSFRWAHQQIEKLLNFSSGTVLEIGCFNGFYVSHLVKMGVDAYGIDININAIDVGLSFFDNLKDRIYTSMNNVSIKKFDNIILIDVFEHVENPLEFISGIKKYLKIGGHLYISGPTLERLFFDRTDKPPHHSWRYSSKGLNIFFLKNEFVLRHSQIEQNGNLAIRNFMSLLISGFIREYYGADFQIVRTNVFFSKLLKPFGFIITCIFKIFNIQYCSRLLVYEKI